MKPAPLALVGFLLGCAAMGLLSTSAVDMSFFTATNVGAEQNSVISVPEMEKPLVHVAPGLNLSSVWGQPEDDVKGTVVILADFPDNHAMLADLQALPYKTIRLVKGQPFDTPNNLPDVNMASDAAAYVQFIVQNYHDLPPRMFFVSGSFVPEWRQELPETIATIDVHTKYKYAGFAGWFRCVRADGDNNDAKQLRNCWEDMKADEWWEHLPHMPDDQVSSSGCNMFFVRREQVLAHPIEFYQKLFQWAYTTPMGREAVKVCFQSFWHRMFGMAWHHYQIDPLLLCPKKPSTCAHTHHVYPSC